MSEIQRKITFKIKSKEYILSIPNNGQLIDIESMKILLGKGTYSSMMNSQTVNSVTALDTIDMIAMFTVLLPNLASDLSVKSLSDLDIIDSIELLNIYRKEICPWIITWQKLLASYLNDEDEKG
jgi:hypothetical protein